MSGAMGPGEMPDPMGAAIHASLAIAALIREKIEALEEGDMDEAYRLAGVITMAALELEAIDRTIWLAAGEYR